MGWVIIGLSVSIADFFILAFITVTEERKTQLHYALSKRFQDLDEIKDVAKHGCIGGVSGFIYHNEIKEFYFEHYSDISDKMYELGLTLKDAPQAIKEFDVRSAIQFAVWVCVEEHCKAALDEIENGTIYVFGTEGLS